MPSSAHKAAVGIVADALASLNDALPYEAQAESILDALSAGLHAELAIERGGLQHVESYHDVICPLFIWEYEPDLFDEKPMDCDCGHVYRLSPDVSSVAETPPQEEAERCGAGHVCCDGNYGPPTHDHLLAPEDCPACGYPEPSQATTEAAPTRARPARAEVQLALTAAYTARAWAEGTATLTNADIAVLTDTVMALLAAPSPAGTPETEQ